MEGGPQTWHYGLVARWWAEFNLDGPEIEYFRRFVEENGEPALDVACGAGRLLVPYLRAGLDVDACDISADMVAHCRERMEAEGLQTNLYVQPMHELDLPRRYKTILVCGGFGIGSTRAEDIQALDRFNDHLEPGGTLVFDKDAPYADRARWRYWLRDEHRSLPEPWPTRGDRRRAEDGAEYELRVRLAALDPLDQRLTYELQASMWRGGRLVGEEEHRLTERLYFRDELVMMLEQAGFAEIRVFGGYSDRPARADDDILVFSARKGTGGPSSGPAP
jgi:SAM-dependent methyltransferase